MIPLNMHACTTDCIIDGYALLLHQELLRHVFVHGPYTTGIFRKPGNHKRCIELKTQLESGEEVAWDEVNILSATSVLKVG